MLLQIIFLLCLNSAWASPRNLVGRNYQNQLRIDQDQFIHEIILRHEEDLKHAPRVSVGHDLPVVCNSLKLVLETMYQGGSDWNLMYMGQKQLELQRK